MDKGKKIDNIDLIALMFTKAAEILHWMGAAMMALLLVCSLAAWGWLGPVLQRNMDRFGLEASMYGFNLVVFDAAGQVDMRSIAMFALCGIIVLSLMAMVFRNVNLVLRKSQDSTPFQPDNIRMLREIGYFMIAVPLIELVLSFVVRLLLGADHSTVSVELDGILIGILVLCLTRIFAHGMELEQDVDGLM